MGALILLFHHSAKNPPVYSEFILTGQKKVAARPGALDDRNRFSTPAFESVAACPCRRTCRENIVDKQNPLPVEPLRQAKRIP